MRIIAHRGNLFGPGSVAENAPCSVDQSIRYGFDVEIDLWLSDDGKKSLGHDCPEFEITNDFLIERRPSLWVHAKNIPALQFCLDNNLRCFSHDNDDAVLTSDQYIWRFPRSGLPVTERTIVVLPERSFTERGARAFGVCTDFPFAFRDYEWQDTKEQMKRTLDLGHNMDRMEQRNLDRISKEGFRPIVWQTQSDLQSKSILAIWSRLSSIALAPRLDLELAAIFGPSLRLAKNLHLTWIQMTPFLPHADLQTALEADQGSRHAFHESLASASRYEWPIRLRFSRIVVTPDALVLLAFPSIDLMACRAQMRGWAQQTKVFQEPYVNDLAHVTLGHFMGCPPDGCLEQIRSLNQELNGDCGHAVLNQIELGVTDRGLEQCTVLCSVGSF